MRFVMFYHSLLSDWNHGNAHFLRGTVTELQRRGHDVVVYEPRDGWSLQNLLADQGQGGLTAFERAYPTLSNTARFHDEGLDLDAALADADVVLAHEWNEPALVNAIAKHHARRGHYALLFHDTHHRVVSDEASFARFDLGGYDAILAFGQSLVDLYRRRGWGHRLFVWHEAADTTVFYPRAHPPRAHGDLVWVGNWGDDERAAELEEFLIGPVRRLGLRACVYGVRYPEHALRALASAGITYGGWLANADVPEVFAGYTCTVHVPRRQYTRELPGIPTIRPFEALACGIPLVSAPWPDDENLFVAGRDYLVARDGDEMTRHLAALCRDPERAHALAAAGLRRIGAAHTCRHRVDQLLDILAQLPLRAAGTVTARQELNP
jgi:spore maturation protein CgeB